MKETRTFLDGSYARNLTYNKALFAETVTYHDNLIEIIHIENSCLWRWRWFDVRLDARFLCHTGKKRVRGSHRTYISRQKIVQSCKTIQISTALVFFMCSSSIKPLQSCFRYIHTVTAENLFQMNELGNPLTSYLLPKGLPTPSASTFAIITLSFACENASASCSYIGARFWNEVSWVPRNMCSYRIIAHFAVSTGQNPERQTYIRFLSACDTPPRSEARNWNANKRNDNQYSS